MSVSNREPVAPTSTEVTLHQMLSRKRLERSSPISSPLKQTRSPKQKIRRRLRTGTEQAFPGINAQVSDTSWQTSNHSYNQQRPEKLEDFTVSDDESSAINDLNAELYAYVIQKQALSMNEPSKTLVNLQDYLGTTRVNHTEKSAVEYLQVMDAIADSKDTMMEMLHNLHEKHIAPHKQQWLVVEGDAKVYEILKSLCCEYDEDLKWLIPYPGDWHMLMNFQTPIMKAYYDAGLKSLAQAAGYPPAQIQTCSQFKRTHQFLMEAFEATYRAMVKSFLQWQDEHDSKQTSDLHSEIVHSLKTLPTKEFTKAFNEHLTTFKESIRDLHYQPFKSFIQEKARKDDTWKFWVRFLFEDMMAYLGLFLSIRSGDWSLRMASMKKMAPLFTAYGHQTYQKVIANHIADIICMPTAILTMFQQGGFVVSITGRPWHSVGIDEAHEMLINKSCKTAIVRPSKDYINRVAHYLPYRTKAIENLKQQLFPESTAKYKPIEGAISNQCNDIKFMHNVQAQMKLIEEKCLFDTQCENRGLVNPFTDKKATTEQRHDLLSFREIGEREFLLRIASILLKQPSVKTPNRKRHLLTFSEKKVNTRRISQLERDKRLIMTAMRKKIQHSVRTRRPIERPNEQLTEYPLAISKDGKPLKGSKSYTTNSLEARYKATQVFLEQLSWQPNCCIMEGMFLINTTPLGSHKTLADYAKFLTRRFIITQFNQGCNEVHVLFDNPGRLKNTPKFFEHVRRDATAKVSINHCCDELNSNTKLLQGKWREGLLNCRYCKRRLVIFLGNYFLSNASNYLQPHQTLYVAGAFEDELTDTAWYACGDKRSEPDPQYNSN